MENLISLDDAARRLSVSRCTIARHLKTVRIGARVLVNLVDVEAFIKPKNPPASEGTNCDPAAHSEEAAHGRA